MDETKLNWDDLKLFLAVARSGGLSAAAAITGKSAPTLGRRMQTLEAVIGEELFRRFARGYELTSHGKVLLNKVADLEAQILPLEKPESADGHVLVKVSAGSWMTYVLCRKAQIILEGSSSTRLRFISAEHVLDIAHREAVIGIRNHRPEQQGLACRKVGRVQFAGYAKNKDVRPWIQVTGKTPSAQWLSAQANESIGMEVTAPRNALDLAHAGVARALLPTFVGDAQQGLVRVTQKIPELTHNQWLVTHQDERFVPQVRRTIDRVYDVVRALHKKPE